MPETIDRTTPADFAYAHRGVILLIVLVGQFMAVIDNNIVAIALPTITRAFHVPLGQSQWIATAYIITIIATVLIFGTLSSTLGKSRLFITGLLLFVASSFACGLAGSLPLLVAARVVQGIGAAMLLSISMAIIMQVFPPHERGMAMGYVTATIGLGLIIGPALGGILVDTFGWPFIFFVNVPIGLVLLVPALHYLRLDDAGGGTSRLDWGGIVLLIVLMAGMALALNELSNPPVNEALFTGYAGFCLAALAMFVARERTAAHPLIDLSLVGNRSFVLPGASLVLYITATFILLLILPFYFEGVMGWRPTQVGLMAFVMPVAMIASAPASAGHTTGSPRRITRRPVSRGWGFPSFSAGTGLPRQTSQSSSYRLSLPVSAGRSSRARTRSISWAPSRRIRQGSPQVSWSPCRTSGSCWAYLPVQILLVFQLDSIGYAGAILDAGPAILPAIFGNAMYPGGVICFAAAAFTYRR